MVGDVSNNYHTHDYSPLITIAVFFSFFINFIINQKVLAMRSTSDLRQTRSLSDLGDRKVYDVKVGYNKKKMPPISTNRFPQKAVVVTMYRNGDEFFPGAKVSYRRGRDFFPGFCEYLSQRLKIPEGVRCIFNLKGQLMNGLEDLEDGGTYVASGTKAFKDVSYGKLARIKTGPTIPNAVPLRPDEVLLYRCSITLL